MRRYFSRSWFLPAVTIGAATGFIGISFGVLAVGAGASVLQACVISLFVFTGASQFAAIGVIEAGGAPLAAIGSGLLVGLRNAAYGLAVAPLLPRKLIPRALAAQLTIDESTALAMSHEGDESGPAFLAGGISVFVFWNLGTLGGALAGTSIGDPSAIGLDAALPASLLALLGPRLHAAPARRTAALGAVIALALTPFLTPGLPVILAALAVIPNLKRTGSSPIDSHPAPERDES